MEGSDRNRVITECLRVTERVTVSELAEMTGCSEMTIRRDLDHLAELGALRRVRGGAVSLLSRGESTPFALRQHEAPDIKDRIAVRSGELVSDGESVILDSGTTTLAVARMLCRRRITAIPLDLHSTAALSSTAALASGVAISCATPMSGSGGVTLLQPGGQAQSGTLSLTGHLTELSLRALRADTVVLGVCGLSPDDGLTAHELTEVPVKQAALASARRVIAVCHSAKFGRTGLGYVCPITDIDVVITDSGAPPDTIERLEQSGVVVHRV